MKSKLLELTVCILIMRGGDLPQRVRPVIFGFLMIKGNARS